MQPIQFLDLLQKKYKKTFHPVRDERPWYHPIFRKQTRFRNLYKR